MSDKLWPLLLALLCVALSAAAQLAMKTGMSSAAPAGTGLGQAYGQALTSPWVWGGLALYGLSAVLWLWVLSRLDVSLAYPLVSLGFVLTMWAGVFWLGEPWSWQRLAGAGLIVAGVLVLASDA
jgi:multidrug transporter EmrE-like cation transporter